MRETGLNISLIILAWLVILCIFAVAVAFSFPEATKGMLRSFEARVKSALGPELVGKISAQVSAVKIRAKDGYEFRIRPVAVAICRPYLQRVRRIRENRERFEKKRAFERCIKCHKDLFERVSFNLLYVNHKKHRSKGIPCERCHLSTKHPRPPSPREAVCLGCHDGVRAAGSCDVCHPPGSIYDRALISEKKTEEFFKDYAGGRLVPSGFERGESKLCKQCHLEEHCQRCHNVVHSSDWTLIHGSRILKGQIASAGCWPCHSSQWCADSCHKNPGKKRISPRYPLPVRSEINP